VAFCFPGLFFLVVNGRKKRDENYQNASGKHSGNGVVIIMKCRNRKWKEMISSLSVIYDVM